MSPKNTTEQEPRWLRSARRRVVSQADRMQQAVTPLQRLSAAREAVLSHAKYAPVANVREVIAEVIEQAQLVADKAGQPEASIARKRQQINDQATARARLARAIDWLRSGLAALDETDGEGQPLRDAWREHYARELQTVIKTLTKRGR